MICNNAHAWVLYHLCAEGSIHSCTYIFDSCLMGMFPLLVGAPTSLLTKAYCRVLSAFYLFTVVSYFPFSQLLINSSIFPCAFFSSFSFSSPGIGKCLPQLGNVTALNSTLPLGMLLVSGAPTSVMTLSQHTLSSGSVMTTSPLSMSTSLLQMSVAPTGANQT